MLQLIYDIHTVIAKAQLSFCAHTRLCNAVNQSISIFWSIYIRHKYIHCKDMTQLLHIYMLARCSKLIDFLHYQIDLHASQSHTLQRHDTVFAHIHRTIATSLHTHCNSYTSHIHTLWRHDSAFAHLHACMMQ